MKILGISRAHRFSPDAVDKDESVFRAVCELLEKKGCECCRYEENDVIVQKLDFKQFDLVFSMARDKKTLSLLADEERNGLRIVNSPLVLLSNTRDVMFDKFFKVGLPVPHNTCISTGKDVSLSESLNFPLWVKRCDECTQQEGDVRLVHNRSELHSALQNYASRGIRRVLLCRHISGEVLKFYGVRGTGFFYVVPKNGVSIDEKALKNRAEYAADLCNITVYGGDVVVNNDGFFIIDFNDWPSFSACREAAAEAVVNCLLSEK